ncbi:hypothetical protein L6164_028080 [Bauhinia variegata]|uniref:Uncharacterized protein n=1 Tax=Bauhinia variegata TaxID=167791 RepID=A0ACB9LUV3_BAUVA|nr:hypothetical protein L6164_028080 [Bauhinia variegata]
MVGNAVLKTPKSPHFCSHNQIYLFFSSIILIQDCTGTGMPSVNVAAPQYGCYCQNDVVPEHNFKELSSAFSGHIVNWEFAEPTNYGPLLHYQMELMGRETCFRLKSLVNPFQGDLLEQNLTCPKAFALV